MLADPTSFRLTLSLREATLLNVSLREASLLPVSYFLFICLSVACHISEGFCECIFYFTFFKIVL